MRSYWIRRGSGSPLPWLVLLTVALLAAVSGCKKEDVVAAAAEQAAAEAAQRPVITDDVDITAVGLTVYPGARPVPQGELSLSMVASSIYTYYACYRANAPFDRVVSWYRDQMDDPIVTIVGTKGGRSASLREDSASIEDATTRFVLVSETPRGVDILLAADARPARFAVYLDSVPLDKEDNVISAIVEWRQRTTEGGDEWTDAQVLTAKEEARKLLPVLPRPVDVELSYEEAVELLGMLVKAGGEAHCMPPTDQSAGPRGPRSSAPPISLGASTLVESEAAEPAHGTPADAGA